MAKSLTNWDSVQTWERLVASIIASGVKLDLGSIARYYDTTYHTLENRLRKTKKMAQELKKAADGGDAAAAAPGNASPAPAAKSRPATPRQSRTSKTRKEPLNAVANGRVTKTKSTATPTKNKTNGIKPEPRAREENFEVPGGGDDSAGQASPAQSWDAEGFFGDSGEHYLYDMHVDGGLFSDGAL